MKVILLKDVPKIGKKYDIKNVADGYALNLLIPNRLAIPGTAEAIKNIEVIKSKDEGEKKVQQELLVKSLKELEQANIVIKEKANEKGHLFAGIHKEELAKEIEKQTRVNVSPSFIDMEHPIKEIGEHIVTISALGKKANIKIVVEAK